MLRILPSTILRRCGSAARTDFPVPTPHLEPATRPICVQRNSAALIEASGWEPPASDWAVHGLGQIDPDVVRQVAGDALTPQLVARLRPFWTGEHASWVGDCDNTNALALLAQQTVRHIAA